METTRRRRTLSSAPTDVGDVLIIQTTATFTNFAVGRVCSPGQQNFHGGAPITHLQGFGEALRYARSITEPAQKLFLMNLDNGEWSEISR